MVDKKETHYKHNQFVYRKRENWLGEPQSQDIIKVKIKDLVQAGRYKNHVVAVGKNSAEDIEKEKKEWSQDTSWWGRMKTAKFLFFLPGGGIYPWEKLKNSIEKNGYQPEKYGYILVRETKDSDNRKWLIVNGNHRLKVLQDLYGGEHVIKVRRTYNTPRPEFKNRFLNLPLMYFPALIFFIIYLLGSILLTSFLIYLTLAFIKDKNDSKFYLTDVHPLKGLGFIYNKTPKLYEFIMTIYYNLGYVISSIILLFFIYHIFSNYWLEFFVMTGITLVITSITGVLIDKLNLNKTPSTFTLEDLIKLIKKNDK